MHGYGITNPHQALSMARDVCDVLGHGSTGVAVNLLVETACQETWLGAVRDRTAYGAGTGLCQIDKIAFVDIVQRTSKAKKTKVLSELGIDLNKIQYRELELSPLASMVFCRLHYLLVPDAVPVTLEARADYWKRFYNTVAGKGHPAEYVRNYERFGRKLMEETL